MRCKKDKKHDVLKYYYTTDTNRDTNMLHLQRKFFNRKKKLPYLLFFIRSILFCILSERITYVDKM